MNTSTDEFREIEPRMVFCPVCDGEGLVHPVTQDGIELWDWVDCECCNGTGEVPEDLEEEEGEL